MKFVKLETFRSNGYSGFISEESTESVDSVITKKSRAINNDQNCYNESIRRNDDFLKCIFF